ncbi:IPT/TIG domain-containing protein [Segatella hominis]|uniref:IPT/TIG domain-containing protein n=1 Tax=Segatella hominis TaxID=2518605 RepID=UPI003F808F8E
MKKLISMMLMLCAIITFSACSSDDDGPSNPVSNQVVPSSAKIGSEVTVQGNGFASGQTIYLQPEQGAEVNANAKMTSNGATFTIPYTMTPGKVNVVLKVANDSFTLGSMNLLAADNPISTLSLPADMAIGQEVTIAGIGFAQGDKIVVGDKTIDATVTTDGVKFTVPADLAEGEYAVSLVRGNSTWELGKVYAYQQRQVESITITDNAMLDMYAPMLGLEEGKLILNFAYNEDGSLKAISSNGAVEWAFEYSSKTITTKNLYDQPIAYTIDDQGRIISSTGYDMYGDAVAYTWNYDANGYLVSVKKNGAADNDDANLLNTYTDGNLSAYTMSLANGLATDKSIRTCPNTIEPLYLLNAFGWMQTREDLFLGFLLNRNVKVSTYVPSQLIAAEMDESGAETSVTAGIESSFTNNTLTMQTTGSVISSAQSIFANKVVVTYKKK